MMKNNAFTFIETLVVISVLGLIFPILFSTLFILLQQQLKIFRLTEVKRQGDHIIGIVENIIKNNANTIYNGSTEICEASDIINSFPHSGTPTSFRDKYNSSFSINYSAQNLSISYPNPILPAPTFAFPQGQLNSSKLIIPVFSISCNRISAYSAPLISLNFTICYNNAGSCISSRQDKIASLDYQTNIKLRNFPTQ